MTSLNDPKVTSKLARVSSEQRLESWLIDRAAQRLCSRCGLADSGSCPGDDECAPATERNAGACVRCGDAAVDGSSLCRTCAGELEPEAAS